MELWYNIFMKLLLTSNGLSNQSIANALFSLVGKKPEETVISFVPTAMNVTSGDKDWFVNDLNNLLKQGLKELDIVDISALPKKVWQPRLDKADVLFFSGGDSNHLMRWIKESGLLEILPEYMKTKVWGGISAGSIVTNPSLAVSSNDKKIYYEEEFGYRDEEALNFVNFYTRPHFNSPYFPHANEEYLRVLAKDFKLPLYALDDASAISVNGDKIEIISEGDYLKI